MPWTVYCHTHVESGRRYVGLTKYTMMHRWNQHCAQAKRSDDGRSFFQNAIRKYGKDAFSHEVLQTYDTLEAANAAEERWIEKLGTRDPKKGFNLMKGGKHTPHPVKNPWDRPEYRRKATEASQRTWSDPVRRAFASSSRVGVKLSDHHRTRISESRVGKTHTEEAKKNMSAAQKLSLSRPSVKGLLSKAALRRWSDPNESKKMLDSIKTFGSRSPGSYFFTLLRGLGSPWLPREPFEENTSLRRYS